MSKRGRAQAGSSGLAGTWLKGLKILVVQDKWNLTSGRAKKIHENAEKGGAEADLVLYELNKGSPLDPEDADAYTHVVTELPEPQQGVMVAGLGLKPHGEGGPLIVKPLWVSMCFTSKSRVSESDFMDFSDVKPLPTPVPASALSDDDGKPKGKKARTDGPEYEELPLSVLDDYTGLEDDVREALVEWYGGKIRKYQPKAFPKWACQRPTVFHHANQRLSAVFEELVSIYNAVGDSGREISFGRTLSIIRGWPTRIRSGSELKDVLKVGPSAVEVIKEVLDTGGRCTRLEKLKADPDTMALVDLCRVHGVGHRIATKWVMEGYRSVEQIRAELDGEAGTGQACRFREACGPSREQLYGLMHFYDVNEKMPRARVERLAKLVREAAVQWLTAKGLPEDDLLVEIAGSYRRGKKESGDLDVLMTVKDGVSHGGLREGLKAALEEMGVDLIVLKDAAEGGFTTTVTHLHEKLESHRNILSMIKFEGRYRRVDVITVPYNQWAFAVLGWSGSKQLEKDIRDHAAERGLHLSQQAVYMEETGLAVRNPKAADGVFRTEHDIFDYLGLKYLPPCLRWA